ncbi:DUF4621 domain-containing protein [Parabacteroides sp. APC149_11_2_Y6]
MRGKILFQALLAIVFFCTACVDSKYDLSKVDTDDITIGDEWVVPLGSGSVEVDDVIKVYKVPSIKIEEDGSYTARYEKELDIMQSVPGVDVGIPLTDDYKQIAFGTVDLKDLQDLFDEGFVLGLVDPHILLNSELTEGDIDCRFIIVGGERNATANFVLEKDKPNAWIGPNESSVKEGYTFAGCKELPTVIENIPSTIELNLLGKKSTTETVSISSIGYELEIPLVPSASFQAVTTEHVKDAFDESFVDYLFSGGTATIFGTVTNTMPFDLSLIMKIVDRYGRPLDIVFPEQEIKGNTDEFSFEIKSEDMYKMVNAKDIQFVMELSGREQPEALKTNQKISLELKLKKTGGISI